MLFSYYLESDVLYDVVIKYDKNLGNTFLSDRAEGVGYSRKVQTY